MQCAESQKLPSLGKRKVSKKQNEQREAGEAAAVIGQQVNPRFGPSSRRSGSFITLILIQKRANRKEVQL